MIPEILKKRVVIAAVAAKGQRHFTVLINSDAYEPPYQFSSKLNNMHNVNVPKLIGKYIADIAVLWATFLANLTVSLAFQAVLETAVMTKEFK
jgi:hypothetical protein